MCFSVPVVDVVVLVVDGLRVVGDGVVRAGERLSQKSQQTPYHPGSSQLSGTESILFWQRLTEKRFPLQTGVVVVVVVVTAKVDCPEEVVTLS